MLNNDVASGKKENTVPIELDWDWVGFEHKIQYASEQKYGARYTTELKQCSSALTTLLLPHLSPENYVHTLLSTFAPIFTYHHSYYIPSTLW